MDSGSGPRAARTRVGRPAGGRQPHTCPPSSFLPPHGPRACPQLPWALGSNVLRMKWHWVSLPVLIYSWSHFPINERKYPVTQLEHSLAVGKTCFLFLRMDSVASTGDRLVGLCSHDRPTGLLPFSLKKANGTVSWAPPPDHPGNPSQVRRPQRTAGQGGLRPLLSPSWHGGGFGNTALTASAWAVLPRLSAPLLLEVCGRLCLCLLGQVTRSSPHLGEVAPGHWPWEYKARCPNWTCQESSEPWQHLPGPGRQRGPLQPRLAAGGLPGIPERQAPATLVLSPTGPW